MSQASAVAEQAASIDWNIVAAAVAVFCGTLLTTVIGWFQGKKKVAGHLKTDDGSSLSVTGIAIQDNQTIREATLVNREIRDQLVIQNHALQVHCRALEDNTRVMEEFLAELRRRR